jgi:4-amino-4-deoxychorismate lyase
MLLVNGAIQTNVEISDRGLQYGDGLFETIAIRNNSPLFFQEHLQRLAEGCSRLKIPQPDLQVLSSEAQQLCQQNSEAVLKIIITRGSGGRGYKQPETLSPTRILSLHPFPIFPKDYPLHGIHARFCQTPLGITPALAGIKHLNRLEQVLARAEWQDDDIQEGLMQDVNGNLIEGTMSNLFWVKNGQLFTPALVNSGVAGIIRKLVIMLSSQHGMSVQEQNLTQTQLLAADEIFVCNSIIGIWPVIRLANHDFAIGPKTRQIQIWLDELAHETYQTSQ